MKAERPESIPLAGGTDLMVDVNFGRLRPPAIIDVSQLAELALLRQDDGNVFLGSGVTYATIVREMAAFKPLVQASRSVGSPQIRNRGTLGGNLGTASPAGDAWPPLLVDGAMIEIASVRGRRSVALGDFLVGPKRNALAPDEVVVSVRVAPTGAQQTFMKIGP